MPDGVDNHKIQRLRNAVDKIERNIASFVLGDAADHGAGAVFDRGAKEFKKLGEMSARFESKSNSTLKKYLEPFQ